MGVTEGDLSIDVDVILRNCTIPFVKRIKRNMNPRLVL